MRGRVTAREVAERAGVSRATVSYVFNRQARVRVTADTRARVLRAAAELGYTPNPLARGLRGSRTGVLGVVVGNIDVNYVGMDIVRALCEAALARDYHVLIADATGAGRQETAHAEVLVDRAVDALIFNGPNAPEAVALARARGIPVVVVERYPWVPGVPAVHTDNRRGSELAVDHLWRLGHRRLAYVGLGDLHRDDAARYQGAVDAALARGMLVRPEWVYRREDQDAEPTYRWARALLAGPDRPTAVYAGGNLFAIEVLRAAHDLGLRVPGDLSVVSFDAQYAAFTYPRLTTVAAPSASLAAAALALVWAALDGAEPTDEVAVDPVLTVRESTGPAT